MDKKTFTCPHCGHEITADGSSVDFNAEDMFANATLDKDGNFLMTELSLGDTKETRCYWCGKIVEIPTEEAEQPECTNPFESIELPKVETEQPVAESEEEEPEYYDVLVIPGNKTLLAAKFLLDNFNMQLAEANKILNEGGLLASFEDQDKANQFKDAFCATGAVCVVFKRSDLERIMGS